VAIKDRSHITILDSICVVHYGYYGYRHTISICNADCFSAATMIMQTHLNVTVICMLSVLYCPDSSQHVCNSTLVSGGTQWRSWLRHCATSWKVAGSIPDGVT
jgi:hypothetical protein